MSGRTGARRANLWTVAILVAIALGFYLLAMMLGPG